MKEAKHWHQDPVFVEWMISKGYAEKHDDGKVYSHVGGFPLKNGNGLDIYMWEAFEAGFEIACRLLGMDE